MRRVLLHKQGLVNFKYAGRFLYFLFLILCIPVIVKDDGLEEHHEKPIFVCNQSDSDEQSAPSVILESFIAKKDPSIPQANQTLDKKLWALKFDREVWHGDLVDVQHAESSLNASLLTPGGQIEKQWSELNKKLKSSAAERISKDGKGMLVMHCNPRHVRSKSTEQNQSAHGKCLKASHAQNSMITMAKDALPGKVMILPSPNVFHPMIFRLHDQCTWTDQAGSTNHAHRSSAVLSFFDDKRAVRTLELDFNSSLFSSLEEKTFAERVNRLLDEKSTKSACNQGTSKEFTIRNTRSSPLQVYSLMIKGENNRTHGFKVDFLGNFQLGPRQSARLLISHRPDFKTGVTEGDLQLVTSAGILSLGLKANVPKHIQSFCQSAVLFARAKKFFLQVCTLALFLVLLVFGKMLKQEGSIMSDASQWSSTSNAANKLSPQRSHGKSMHYHNDKSSSIYVSIDFGCTHNNESRQCGNLLSLTKAFDAVIGCIIGLKLLYISHVSNAQQVVTSIVGKNDTHTHTKQHNNPTSPTNSGVAGKKRTSTQPRVCNKASFMTSTGGGTSPLRSKMGMLRRDKAIPQLNVTRLLDRAEPESPTAALSDKEKEKVKQKRRKKGIASLVTGMENGSDSGSSSPLSMPSSPVIRDMSCRPVSPLCSGSHISTQNLEAPQVDLDTTMTDLFDKEGSKKSQWHCSTDSKLLPIADKASLHTAESKEDQTSLQARRSLVQEDKNMGFISTKPSAMNRAKEVTVRNSNKGNALTSARGATLTVSTTFPTPGRRFLQEGICRVQEDRHTWPVVASSSSPDLVSTSVVAPHARAPGSPLSPKSPSFSGSPLSSSLFTTFSGSPLSSSSSSHPHTQQSSQMRTSRRWQEGSVEDEAFRPQYTHVKLHHSGARRGTGYYPSKIYEPHYAQKRKEPHHGSEAVLLYDIWGHNFADLGRRWKDAPFTRKPSSLPPLLETPAFSIFSSNDPFSR